MRISLISFLLSLIFTSCSHKEHDVKITNALALDSVFQNSLDSLQLMVSELNNKDYNEAYFIILTKLQYAVYQIDSLAADNLHNREELLQIRAKLAEYRLVIDQQLDEWRNNTEIPDSVYSPDLDSNYQFFSYLVYKKFPKKFDSLVNENKHWLDSLKQMPKAISEKF